MDYQEIRKKYACDDNVTKSVNAGLHELKSKGLRLTKNEKAEQLLTEYIRNANSVLGRGISIYGLGGKSLGVSWAARGTVSVPETLAFIKKLQKAVNFIQKAPKAPTRG